MSLSRRQFLKISGLTLGVGMLPGKVYAQSQVVLPIPPLLESIRGQPIFLSMQQNHWAFLGDRQVASLGFNGRYLGPTIRVRSGDNVKLICNNHLSEAVALTVSGLQIPASVLDNARRTILPEGSWAPILPIDQPACNAWYHSMTPQKMAEQIYSGLAGLWIIEDDTSLQLALPNRYGIDDIPVIIQDKKFNSFAEPEYTGSYQNGFLGNQLITNGVESPFMEVAKGWVRLRLLNASNSRRYLLYLNNGRSFYLVGNDLGLLTAPLLKKTLSIAPGERRDVLVDMSQEESVSIMTGRRQNLFQHIKGLFESSNLLASTPILTLQAVGLMSMSSVDLPTQLSEHNININDISHSRKFVLDDETATINGLSWNQTRIDFQVKFGSTERWIIQANMPQAFHIQGASFRVKKANGMEPNNEDSGWKDTVWVENEVELIVHFSQISTLNYPFLYYSQNLERADAGAMGQYVVV